MRRRNHSPFRSGSGTAPIPDSLSLIRSFSADTNPARPVRPSPLGASSISSMPLDLYDRLKSFPLFSSAPSSFLETIAAYLRPQVASPQEAIVTEGDDAKAMYWIVRGVVAVTSRDGEAILAELKPGAFFGEIGILMDVPRTATIVARTKCLLVSLRKEDLRAELPRWPEMERRIREEAQERLAVLNKKRQEGGYGTLFHAELPTRGNRNLARAAEPGSVGIGEVGRIAGGAVQNSLKRKSPSPSPAMLDDPSTGSALGNGLVNVRKTLMELPLFAGLPNEILHFLGLSAQPRSYAPFCDIIRQGSLGNEIYFIVRGEAEVVHMRRREDGVVVEAEGPRPRLKQGMYFGEVASLALAPRRTATVRAITTVECLMISGEVLEELWRRCSPDLRKQVEHTAKERYGKPKDTDIMMLDAEHEEINGSSISDLKISDSSPKMRDRDLPQVTFTPSFSSPPSPRQPSADEDPAEPTDVDPFLSVDMEAMKTRQMGRRQSWAPVPAEPTSPPKEGGGDVNDTSSPLTRSPGPSSMFSHPITPPQEAQLRSKRARQTLDRRPSEFSQGRLPDSVLLSIFKQLDIYQLMRLRSVSLHWQRLLSFHPALCRTLDLTPFNRHITNTALIDSILPFAGNRPREVDISNCFHITDLGFQALSRQLSPNVKVWKMKSVWDISAAAVLEMANAAKELEEIDLSNCRKVSDNLLARIVGWVVTEAQHAKPPPPRRGKGALSGSAASQAQPPPPPLPGTVIGCPKLRRLTLSYCKHITDRSMAHLAVHAHERLESIDLTRCTTITDAGFAHWGAYRWGQLRRVRLADCTYLGDQAVVSLCHAAPGVRMLDLSFCCALSDTSTSVLSLGLPHLTHLRLAFCGSAVSDSSLKSIGLHLLELKELSVRGCVRVTGVGVEAVVEGCRELEVFDVSQCKNLEGWVRNGGEEKMQRVRERDGGKAIRFLNVKTGSNLR